ncbi:hypothetical protein JAAARDRAFT_81350 [Jaapia argillacea MUCL 33604]|uniref:Uncharacterized protein n=1 Tax=Jaapia argillacea MUCL 33604 TaxID=933084 RepID=A0A067PA69_9AGAM|nr:hypothetical protein JAAARDRAFT_81350 [Jaapia argillacea MUCL 33604]
MRNRGYLIGDEHCRLDRVYIPHVYRARSSRLTDHATGQWQKSLPTKPSGQHLPSTRFLSLKCTLPAVSVRPTIRDLTKSHLCVRSERTKMKTLLITRLSPRVIPSTPPRKP